MNDKPLFRGLILGLAGLVIGLGLGGCATSPEDEAVPEARALPDSLLPEIDAALAEAEASRPGPVAETDVERALVPRLQVDLPERTAVDTEPRFDIKVNRARARDFFMGLVEGTPYNMVVDPRVKGRITLDMKNVTVRQVLETVRRVFGYDYEEQDGNFMVYPNTMTTRLFKVDYLDIKRRGVSQVRVNSGQLTDVRQGNRLNTTGTAQGSTPGTYTPFGQTGRRGVQASSQIDTITEKEFWKSFAESIRAMIGTDKGRSVVVSPESGLVVVRALPSELRTVENFIKQTQNSVQRQVILEAKIIEVELSEHFQAGINWSALAQSGANSALISHIGGGSVFDVNQNGLGYTSIKGNEGNLNPASPSPINGSATSAFGGVFTFALSLGADFAAFLELLKGQGNVQVLSSPKVSTLNNTKAVIKVGQEEFFVTNVYSNTALTAGASTTGNNVELTPFFSGVVLDVVPQISDNGRVTLFIHPTISRVDEQEKNVALTATDQLTLPLAFSTVRESDTIINAQSGQVVVIGGLMQDKVLDFETSVPFFGDIPLIGGLFRHKAQRKVKSELVILLKPIVVEGDGTVWREQIRRHRANFDSFRERGAESPPTP